MEYMDLLPPTAPSLVFARETCTPYCFVKNEGNIDIITESEHGVEHGVLSTVL